MADIEKVIKGFDICKNIDGSCDGCPYFDNELGENSCMREHLMPDAIELLKEKQPKKGEWDIDEYGIHHCPFCKAINATVYQNFCPNCGADMRRGR